MEQKQLVLSFKHRFDSSSHQTIRN